MRFKIYKFKKVTSTNDIAINLIKEKKSKRGFVYAVKQTKGRGTRGRKWASQEGNFFGSIFFQLQNKYPSFSEFSLINPVIISNVIKKYCKKNKVSLKFPNDVFLNKKKICGILQEIITLNKRKFLIIGIGANLVSNPKIKNNYEATNIFFETKNKPKTKELISSIILSYERFFKNLNSYEFKYFKNKAEKMSFNII